MIATARTLPIFCALIPFVLTTPGISTASAEEPNPLIYFDFLRRVAEARQVDRDLGQYRNEAINVGRSKVMLYLKGQRPIKLVEEVYRQGKNLGNREFYFKDGQLSFVKDDRGRYGFSGSSLVFWFDGFKPADYSPTDYQARENRLYTQAAHLLDAFRPEAPAPPDVIIPDYDRNQVFFFQARVQNIDQKLTTQYNKHQISYLGSTAYIYLDNGVPRKMIIPLRSQRAPGNARRHLYYDKQGHLFYVHDFRGDSGFTKDNMVFWFDQQGPVQADANLWQKRESLVVKSSQDGLNAFTEALRPNRPDPRQQELAALIDFMAETDNNLARYTKYTSPRGRGTVVLYATNRGTPRLVVEPYYDRENNRFERRKYYYRKGELEAAQDAKYIYGFKQGELIFYRHPDGSRISGLAGWQIDKQEAFLVARSADILNEVAHLAEKPNIIKPVGPVGPPIEQPGPGGKVNIGRYSKDIQQRIRYYDTVKGMSSGGGEIRIQKIQRGNTTYEVVKNVAVGRIIGISEYVRRYNRWLLVSRSAWRDNRLWAVGDDKNLYIIEDRRMTTWLDANTFAPVRVDRGEFYNRGRAVVQQAFQTRNRI